MFFVIYLQLIQQWKEMSSLGKGLFWGFESARKNLILEYGF